MNLRKSFQEFEGLRDFYDHNILSTSTEEQIQQWMKQKGSSYGFIELQKLPGDASSRVYYRLVTQTQSMILTKMENFEKEGLDLPFLKIQEHLSAIDVDVPKIIDCDPKRGFILLEDLGDITLLRKLQNVSNPEVERHLYQRVIDELVEMHVKSADIIQEYPQLMPAYQLKFDVEKLMWEVNFTFEHFYTKNLQRHFSEKDLNILNQSFLRICQELENEPTVFTHRDFHSRNVMICSDSQAPLGERFVMIDFQDARMGPAQYDLASLLRDSYYQLDESQVRRLIDYYVIRYEALSGRSLDRKHFIRIFDLMSIQRNYKAIGSFASFLNRRGNPGYLKFIGNTFENIRRTLLKYPEYSELREVLFHYYYF